MKLHILQGPRSGEWLDLNKNTFTVGRETDNDFVISVAGVSRHHCRFSLIDGDWMVEDLRSINGTIVNGKKVDGGMLLQAGDEITVFSCTFKLEADSLPVIGPTDEMQVSEVQGKTPAGRRLAVKIGAAVLIALAIGSAVCWLARSSNVPEKPGEEPQATAQAEPPQEAKMIDDQDMDSLQAPETAAPPGIVKEIATPIATAEAPKAEPVPEQKPAAVENRSAIVVKSNPPGAVVMVDGTPAGETPAVIENLSAGRHTLELDKSGYDHLTRQFQLPLNAPLRTFELSLKPGTLVVSTRPAGAEIWNGRQLLGSTPLTVENMKAGRYELTVTGPGCEMKKVPLEMTESKGERLDLDLTSVLGCLEVQTAAPGCKVFIDGAYVGDTTGPEGGPLVVGNLRPGLMALKIVHASGIFDAAVIAVSAKNEPVKVKSTLWVPTHKITMPNDETIYGIVQKDKDGGAALQSGNLKIKKLDISQMDALEKMEQADYERYIQERGDRKKPGENGNARSFVSITADDFMAKFPIFESNQYLNQKFSLTGFVTGHMKGGNGIYIVNFSPAIRCYMVPGTSREDMEAISSTTPASDKIRLMSETKGCQAAPIVRHRVSIRGEFRGIKDGVATLVNCIRICEPD